MFQLLGPLQLQTFNLQRQPRFCTCKSRMRVCNDITASRFGRSESAARLATAKTTCCVKTSRLLFCGCKYLSVLQGRGVCFFVAAKLIFFIAAKLYKVVVCFCVVVVGVFVVVVGFSCRRKCVHFQRRNVTAATLDLWQRLPVPLAVSATIRDLSLQSKYTFAAANLPSNVQALQKQPNFKFSNCKNAVSLHHGWTAGDSLKTNSDTWAAPTQRPRGLTFTWSGCYGVDINQPTLPTPFYSVLVSISLFMALSTVFHSINSPGNSQFSHSVLPVLSLPYWSFQLYISLWQSPSALI